MEKSSMPIRITMSTMHRTEGFPGQHLIALPPKVLREFEQDPTLRGLFPTDAGYYPRAEGHFVQRPHGTKSCIWILCSSGQGWVRMRDSLWRVQAGDVVLIDREEPHEYGAYDSDPWHIEWVHWTGNEYTRWWKLLDRPAGEPLMRLLPDTSMQLSLRRVWQTLEQGMLHSNLMAASALRLALAQLVQLNSTHRACSSGEAVAETITWLNENVGHRISVRELATSAHLSVAQYAELFREQTGTTPLGYCIGLKIQLASRLLETTLLSVKEIADRVGYEDPLYFSRVFAQWVGTSPRDYRRIFKGDFQMRTGIRSSRL